jgi:hypothetical protein
MESAVGIIQAYKSYYFQQIALCILLPELSSQADEISGDHQCGFRRNRSTKDEIFRIRLILGINGSALIEIHELCFKKTCISVMREML